MELKVVVFISGGMVENSQNGVSRSLKVLFKNSSYILISPLHADFRTVLRFSVRLLVLNSNDKV